MDEAGTYVFQLNPNEEYSERCGEVFLTNIGYLVFHCTLCDMKFKGFERFADHVRDEHLLSSNLSDSFLDSELAQFDYDCDYDYDLANTQGSQNSNTESMEEIIEEHIDFEIVNENDASSIQEDHAETNLLQSIEDLENGIEATNLPTNEIEYGSDKQLLKEALPNSDFRHLRKANRGNITPAERKHKCHICGAAFKDKHNRNHHVMRHTDVKKFPCLQCEKKFFTAAERRVHLRTHTQERPFLCSECGLSFVTNVCLVNHIKRHKKQRDYPCPHCEKAFYERSILRTHLYTHSNKKPYECKICNSGYIHRRSLKKHMMIHTNY